VFSASNSRLSVFSQEWTSYRLLLCLIIVKLQQIFDLGNNYRVFNTKGFYFHIR